MPAPTRQATFDTQDCWQVAFDTQHFVHQNHIRRKVAIGSACASLGTAVAAHLCRIGHGLELMHNAALQTSSRLPGQAGSGHALGPRAQRGAHASGAAAGDLAASPQG